MFACKLTRIFSIAFLRTATDVVRFGFLLVAVFFMAFVGKEELSFTVVRCYQVGGWMPNTFVI